MTSNIEKLLMDEHLAAQFPASVTFEVKGDKYTFFSSNMMYMYQKNGRVCLMVEYRDIESEMDDLLRYSHAVGERENEEV